MKKCDKDRTQCLHESCLKSQGIKCCKDCATKDTCASKCFKVKHGVMRKNIIEWEFRRGNESRKIRFEVECTLEEFAEFLDVIEPFGDKWAARIATSATKRMGE